MKTIINKFDFLKKTVFIQWNDKKKENLLSFATKLIEKIPHPSKTKEYYQSYLKVKN